MAGSYSNSHPILVQENRGDMETRTGGGYDPATDGDGFHFPDPDTIRGVPFTTMTAEQAAWLGIKL
jgi:hypothetical protein